MSFNIDKVGSPICVIKGGKYNKTKINPIIQKFKQEGYDINVFGTFPSLTFT
jgi:hypothetical protein